MNPIKLIQPTATLRKEFYEMLKEWKEENVGLVPFTLAEDSSDFEKYVEKLLGFSNGIGVREGFVPHTTLWLVDENNKILGTSDIRHRLNEKLLVIGGHIGYGIRPSERRKGFATKILEFSLLETQKIGIEKVLITCLKSNIGSAKAIQKNGGELWKEHIVNGELIQNYWILNI